MSRLTKEQAAAVYEYCAVRDGKPSNDSHPIHALMMPCILDMKDELAQAEADRDTLAAEVRAWRDGDGKGHDCAMAEPGYVCPICTAAAATDASGALDRAAKEPQ